MASQQSSELPTAYVSTMPCLAQQQQCRNQSMLALLYAECERQVHFT